MKRAVFFFFLISLCCLPSEKLLAGATLTTLHVFHSTDGNGPMAGLVQATNGNFYGTTAFGGAYSNCIGGCGAVFEITPAGNFTLLHSFTNYDGSEPLGGLVQGDDGNLYGTTAAGGRFGPGGLGSVFRISPGGEFRMIHSYTTSDGFDPGAGLIIGPDGAFYGTTAGGGQNGVGTAYRITT